MFLIAAMISNFAQAEPFAYPWDKEAKEFIETNPSAERIREKTKINNNSSLNAQRHQARVNDSIYELGIKKFKEPDRLIALVQIRTFQTDRGNYKGDKFREFINVLLSQKSRPTGEQLVQLQDNMSYYSWEYPDEIMRPFKEELSIITPLYQSDYDNLTKLPGYDESHVLQNQLLKANSNNPSRKLSLAEITQLLDTWKHSEATRVPWIMRALFENATRSQIEELARYAIAPKSKHSRRIFKKYNSQLAGITNPEIELKLIHRAKEHLLAGHSPSSNYFSLKRNHPEVQSIIDSLLDQKEWTIADQIARSAGYADGRWYQTTRTRKLIRHYVKNENIDELRSFIGREATGLENVIIEELNDALEKERQGFRLFSNNSASYQKLISDVKAQRTKAQPAKPHPLTKWSNGQYSADEIKQIAKERARILHGQTYAGPKVAPDPTGFYQLADAYRESANQAESKKITELVAEHLAQAPRDKGGLGYSPDDAKVFIQTVMEQDNPWEYIVHIRKHQFNTKDPLIDSLRAGGKLDPRNPGGAMSRRAYKTRRGGLKKNRSCLHGQLEGLEETMVKEFR